MDGASQRFDTDALQTKYQAGFQESQWSMAIGQGVKTVGDFVSGSLGQFLEGKNRAEQTVLEAQGKSTDAAASAMSSTATQANDQLRAIRDTMANVRGAMIGIVGDLKM